MTGYATRKDGNGWRAVGGAEDIGTDENYSESQPALTVERIAAAVRAKRDLLIAAIAWRIERYLSEARQGAATTDDIVALDTYVQALRDITEQPTFPDVVWPTAP